MCTHSLLELQGLEDKGIGTKGPTYWQRGQYGFSGGLKHSCLHSLVLLDDKVRSCWDVHLINYLVVA